MRHLNVVAGINYIIKALWLPGTQTQQSVVTAEFVKVSVLYVISMFRPLNE